jgi:predicted aspartyl protease
MARWREKNNPMKYLIAGILLLISGSGFSETIGLEAFRSGYLVPVGINDQPAIPFLIDTGSGDVSLPREVFANLVRIGTISQSDYLGVQSYIMADGSEHKEDRYNIHRMVLGNHVITNVAASVSVTGSYPLLGESFLSRLPIWAIDNRHHQLILDDTPDHGIAGLTTTPTSPALAQQPRNGGR